MKLLDFDFVTTVVNLACIALAIRFYLRIRRGCPTCAQLAMDAMADGCMVEGVKLPEPGDSRWVEEWGEFDRRGTRVKHACLKLGRVLVQLDNKGVYVGPGEPLVNSKRYAARVIAAYRQRLVDKAVNA